MNIKLTLEYDGSPFFGWQRQRSGETVQGHLEAILTKVEGRKVAVYGAGRTDSGVHALGQIANFCTEHNYTCERWLHLLNYHLPKAIRVVRVERVGEKFHAQRNAVGKIYEYRVLNRNYASALNNRVYFYPKKVDWERVNRAAALLEGEKDFASFQGAGSEVKTTVRTIWSIRIQDRGAGEYAIRVHGSGFLKQMVRAIVGTLLDVGVGKIPIESVSHILTSCDRRRAGHTAPACGLYLMRVDYPSV